MMIECEWIREGRVKGEGEIDAKLKFNVQDRKDFSMHFVMRNKLDRYFVVAHVSERHLSRCVRSGSAHVREAISFFG